MAANPVELTTAATLPQFNIGEKYYVYIFPAGDVASAQNAYILVCKTICGRSIRQFCRRHAQESALPRPN
jgi:hypothetical protein